jgi:branched-chain amino acid transport system permease protein
VAALLQRRGASRLLGWAVLAGAAIAWPFFFPKVTHFYGALSAIYALVALSLVVLSGWTGQVSLCQGAFLGIGVYMGQKLLAHNVPVLVAVVVVAAIGAAVSLLIGVPSLRLRGVYLTIVTLAFAAACEKFVFPLSFIRGSHAADVPRPPVFGLSTHSDRGLYFVVLGVFAVALLLAANIRRSDAGRALFAIRDSEDAATALGIKVAPYKIGAFALSAALATVAGLFYGMLIQATPGGDQFGVLQSLFLLALPVLGGLELLGGAVIGGALLATAQPAVNTFHIRLFLASGVLVVLVTLSGFDGITGLARSAWRSLREQLSPTAKVRYGSFVPEDPAVAEATKAPPRVRLRVPGGLVPGSRVTVRIDSPPAVAAMGSDKS